MSDNWVKIYEYYTKKDYSEIWLHDMLKEKNIPFKNDIETEWEGRRIAKYSEKVVVYVPIEYKRQAEKCIIEYENPNNMKVNGIEELKTKDDTEEEAKQYANKQKTMWKIYMGIVILMVAAMIIAYIYTNMK